MNTENFYSEEYYSWLHNWLSDMGVADGYLAYMQLLILLTTLIIISSIAYYISKALVVRIINMIFLKTSNSWDDLLVEHKVFEKAAHIVPAILVKLFLPLVFRGFEEFIPFLAKITDIYIILVLFMVLFSFLKVVEQLLANSHVFKDKPINSYFQLLRIVLYIAGGILVLSAFLDRSPLYFLSAFGAMTAILLLIFKDTILGLVASVQISSNDMVRVGDWIEMPKYNADGDVIAMNLHTVKVQNWDKTITTIPSHYLITDSFKNWRGMNEVGGRRIKRAIYINLRSIKFVDEALKERLRNYYLIKDYVVQRQEEIEEYNNSHDFDTNELINGRRMTNIGVFRRYALSYLQNHQGIRQDMTLLVRQLTLGENGLPLEIYCFTASTAWVKYEDTQSDIFDHLIAATKNFDLEVFQNTSGNDIMMAAEKLVSARP